MWFPFLIFWGFFFFLPISCPFLRSRRSLYPLTYPPTLSIPPWLAPPLRLLFGGLRRFCCAAHACRPLALHRRLRKGEKRKGEGGRGKGEVKGGMVGAYRISKPGLLPWCSFLARRLHRGLFPGSENGRGCSVVVDERQGTDPHTVESIAQGAIQWVYLGISACLSIHDYRVLIHDPSPFAPCSSRSFPNEAPSPSQLPSIVKQARIQRKVTEARVKSRGRARARAECETGY